jgi:hypothetical protein
MIAAPRKGSGLHESSSNARNLGRTIESTHPRRCGRGLAMAAHQWRRGDHFAFVAGEPDEVNPGNVFYGTVLVNGRLEAPSGRATVSCSLRRRQESRMALAWAPRSVVLGG